MQKTTRYYDLRPNKTNETFRKESKLYNERYGEYIQCSCTNKVPMHCFKNKEYAECNFCHKLVYKDKAKQEAYEKEYKQKQFELKLRKYMKESEKNVSETRRSGFKNTRKSNK